MSNLPEVGARAVLESSDWEATMRRLRKNADGAFDDAIADLNRFEKNLNAVGGNVDINVDVDAGELNNIQTLVDNLDADGVTIAVNVDQSELAAVQTLVDGIDSEAPLIPFSADDTELLAAQRLVTTLDGESIDTKVNAEVDPDLSKIETMLQTIQGLSVINIALSLPANFDTVMGALEDSPLLKGTLDAANAESVVGLVARREIENANEIIDTLYLEGLGPDRETIARTVGELSNLGIDNANLESAARAIYRTSLAVEKISGEAPDIVDLTNRMADMNASGFVKSWSGAEDFIVSAAQSSVGIGGDFLGDIGEFQTNMASLGLTAQESFNILETGLGAGGVDNISRMSEGILSFNELASGMDENFVAGLSEIDAAVGTNLTEQLDLFHAGEISGGQFLAGVLDGAREFDAQEGRASVQGVLGKLFGGTATNIGAGAILSLDPNADEFTPLENRGKEVAEEIEKNFQQATLEIGRQFEDLAKDFMSSEAIDLPGKLEDVKRFATDFGDALQGGETVGGALEISLKAPGLEMKLAQVESGIGNAVIALAQVVQQILTAAGQTEAAAQVGGFVAEQGARQFGFDLKNAQTEKEIQSLVQTAWERGVSEADIQASADTGVAELIERGEVGRAQALVDAIEMRRADGDAALQEWKDSVAANERQSDPLGFIPDLDTALPFEDFYSQLSDQQKTFYESMLGTPVKVNLDTADMQTQIDAAAPGIVDEFNAALASGDFTLAQSLAENLGGGEFASLVTDATQNAFNSALNSGNFTLAQAIADQSNSPEMQAAAREAGAQITAGFDQSIREGNLWQAVSTALLSGDESLINGAGAAAFDSFLSGFESRAQGGIGGFASLISGLNPFGGGEAQSQTEASAIVSDRPDTKEGTGFAGLLGIAEDVDPLAAAQPYRDAATSLLTDVAGTSTGLLTNVPIIGQLMTDMSLNTATTTGEVNTSLTGVKTTADEVFPGVQAGARLTLTSLLGLGGAIGTIRSLAGALRDLTGAANDASGAVQAVQNSGGPPTASVPAAAGGGDFGEGMALVGERGPELVSSSGSFSVLNAASTASVFSAIDSFLNGGSSGTVNNNNQRSTSVNNYINYAPPQTDPDAIVATAIRGF